LLNGEIGLQEVAKMQHQLEVMQHLARDVRCERSESISNDYDVMSLKRNTQFNWQAPKEHKMHGQCRISSRSCLKLLARISLERALNVLILLGKLMVPEIGIEPIRSLSG
jgi:hypothetical protein